MGFVYLIHFDTPYKHARHYVGYTEDLEARLKRHEAGHGARLMEVVAEHKITYRVAKVWEGTRDDERALKKRKNTPRLCPICRADLKKK